MINPKVFILILLGIFLVVLPVNAQDFPWESSFPQFNFDQNLLWNNDSNSEATSGCIKLDGRCQFSIAASSNELESRIDIIEQILSNVSEAYFANENASLNIELKEIDRLQDIYIYVDNQEFRLMSVTNWDAEIDNTTILNKAELIKVILSDNLAIAKQERKPKFLIQQTIVATCILAFLGLSQIFIFRWVRGIKLQKEKLLLTEKEFKDGIKNKLVNRKQIEFQEIKNRLLQLANISIWISGILIILDLFPYTRFLQIIIFNFLRIPLRIAIISFFTYVLIRLSYALINQFSSLIVNDITSTPIGDQRLEIRIRTIFTITSSIITVTLIAIGIILILSSLGVNIAPLLTGLGIFSLALSLGSQNLIKDTINGFFIILEDQYAVGDMISLNEATGLVENMNLRITQLRDAEGSLITIPNGEIKIVANKSNQWSRADVNIPVPYNTDIDKVLDIIHQVAQVMFKEELWHDQILEAPDILGVDDFSDRGLVIRVWIKTKPLKQWLVSREFRHRLIIALNEANINITLPLQDFNFS